MKFPSFQPLPVVERTTRDSITDEVGMVSLELVGERTEINKAIKWLEGLAINVEPVESNLIGG